MITAIMRELQAVVGRVTEKARGDLHGLWAFGHKGFKSKENVGLVA
jgi:hypothetical protein